ncbi:MULTISPECIES: 2-hydroxychromene-2-carboxylate isomerase [unclassified Cupriavidus]|uniref:2-hydroxychromene-2-carboxylate isomerase n=1 Tax=unclassified Cupriavidus TaxID=2640874 RepID=UPI001C006B2F|nr:MULTISPECIES: 2-hydroxychromene-2-carboxylate isomerase [unclassified Cupriavidus]MCA3183356.1 2-hydroxychromene-2-carboxylate isomerase [Cupriavidus sp.]MCA3194078.1 2-hydroxychromene-2-carboxylate isomerase [Cupriavidus sp.]MCA3200282.1 2-hydroxychromene-2-carboxylate isomerase [Cupriavidus sp.]MCA3231024.1 2-hydroxychromene-2-carboxylate isomerase [Cupriavidus sp.]QWE97587.1 2-hydroxychromene-2-carboxylate isomerase [Cupriavidus sp. EM10]
MPAPTVQFLLDFGSPNAYLSHKVIPEIESRTGVTFEYIPILLGGLFRLTGNRSPAEAFAGIKNKQDFARLETQRFIDRHNIVGYRVNPHFPVNTLQIMRGAATALIDGGFETYVDVVFSAMWERGLKMDDPAVIEATLNEAGIDGARILARIGDQAVKDLLLANTQRAFERGAFGSPTFFVNDEMYFGKDQLRDVEEEIQRVLAQ